MCMKVPEWRTCTYPEPVVAFGNDVLSMSPNAAESTHNTMQTIASGVKIIGKLGPEAEVAAAFVTLFLTIAPLIDGTNELLRKLEAAEGSALKVGLSGKLESLRNSKSILENNSTSSVQKVAELVNAMSQFREILPNFTEDVSIIRQRIHLGAPLLVNVYILFGLFFSLFKNIPGYHDPNLESLAKNYTSTLESFKTRIIRERILSVYSDYLPFRNGFYWYHDLQKDFPQYFGDGLPKNVNFLFERRSFETGVISFGKRFNTEINHYYYLIDDWDNFERNLTKSTMQLPGTTNDADMDRNCIKAYRTKIVDVMSSYFDDARATFPDVQAVKRYSW